MKAWGVNAADVRRIVADVSTATYDGNLTVNRCDDASGNRAGRAAEFTLRVVSSRAAGARTSHSGRRSVAATWQAHYDVMLALFDAGATRIRSSMADYRGAPHRSATRSLGYDLSDRGRMLPAGPYPTGRDAFLAIADRTYDINAGSIMTPAAFGNL